MKTVLILSDMHVPSHDQRLLDTICRYLADFPVDVVLQIGDMADCRAVNPHIRHKPRLRENLRLADELDAVSRVNRLLYASAQRAEHIRLLGNHEQWVSHYLNEHPEISKDIPDWEDIHGEIHAKVLPYRRNHLAYRLGNLHFHHGYGKGGKTAVRKMLDDFNVNLVTGHLHRMEQVSKPSAHGTMSAWTIGHMALPTIGDDYVDGPTSWQQGFAKAFIRANGSFQVFPINVVHGAFVAPEGDIYFLRHRLGSR